MALLNTEPIPHNLKGKRCHFPPVLTIPCGTEGSALLLLPCCPKHRTSNISFSLQISSFKSQNREKMENRTKATTHPWFVIVTWKIKKKKKKKRHKRKLMSDAGRSSSPLLWAHCTAIFPSLFYTVIKGYSEPLKMPSTLIENEIEHISIEAFTAVIIATCWPEQGAFTDKDGF